MSQSSFESDAPLPDGYLRVFAGGYEMVLYQGFVRAARVTPQGGTAVALYEQEGRYDVPGRQPPAARSNVILRGGAHARDVHLHLINEPQNPQDFKGPIAELRVALGTPGPLGPVINRPDLVQIVRGADQVVRIDVVPRVQGEVTEPLEPSHAPMSSAPSPVPTEPLDGEGTEPLPTETWTVEDNAATCPHDC